VEISSEEDGIEYIGEGEYVGWGVSVVIGSEVVRIGIEVLEELSVIETEEVWVIVYVMQEQAEETAFTSPAQFSKSAGIADESVMVLARKVGQKLSASA
jgi:hypothetical protein